jgi:copper chaperone CopZ
MSTSEIVMEMQGFGCPSCVYTIEKTGRKIPGVEKIAVSMGEQRIRIQHNGQRDTIIQKVSEIVQRIGHDVRVLPDETPA